MYARSVSERKTISNFSCTNGTASAQAFDQSVETFGRYAKRRDDVATGTQETPGYFQPQQALLTEPIKPIVQDSPRRLFQSLFTVRLVSRKSQRKKRTTAILLSRHWEPFRLLVLPVIRCIRAMIPELCVFPEYDACNYSAEDPRTNSTELRENVRF